MNCPRCVLWATDDCLDDGGLCARCRVGVPRVFTCLGCDCTVAESLKWQLCEDCEVPLCSDCALCCHCQGYKRSDNYEKVLASFVLEQARHATLRTQDNYADMDDDMNDMDFMTNKSRIESELHKCQAKLQALARFIPPSKLMELLTE